MSVSVGLFTKETLVNGQPRRVNCLDIGGQTYSVSRNLATLVRLEDEWYDDVADPGAVIAALRRRPFGGDIFTFLQRLPETEPRFDFHTEWDSIAVLPITSFDHWWTKQIKPETRNLVRKAQKRGVEVREAVYDDNFVRGMTEIFNETPIRQGRRFWHFDKDFDTVKRQFSRYLFREDLLGAYYEDRLIGFIMLGNAERYGVVGQLLSRIDYRDKSPSNALVAKAVEVCERRGLPYLVYASWGDGSLVNFKRHNGFREARLPRYYVPLTWRGQVAMRLGLHRAWNDLVPASVKNRLKGLRGRWLTRATARSAGDPCRG